DKDQVGPGKKVPADTAGNKTSKCPQYRHHRHDRYQQRGNRQHEGFRQELKGDASAAAAHYLPDTDLFAPADGECGGKIDEVDGRQHEDKGGNPDKCVQGRGMRLVKTVIDQSVEMDVRQRLKY